MPDPTNPNNYPNAEPEPELARPGLLVVIPSMPPPEPLVVEPGEPPPVEPEEP